jgi:isoleucyl-tRNA synthetase
MSDSPAPDYRDTVFLPKTEFPMRGSLPQKEPELLARWRAMDLYTKLRQQAEGREKYILHDGPPYANGHIHLGTALTKILKDTVNRSYQMLGYDAPYVPGWDCHGLPIEWKIEEQYRAAGKDKDQVDKLQFRAECRAFAAHWQQVQSEEFQRLGVIGDWAHPYSTMTNAAEAQIARELHKFLMNGLLYRGVKPVMWSVVEKTALAEAEIEYHDHTSTTIWVKFPVVTQDHLLSGSSIVIWTTTPWTIPGNRAIAFGDFAYALLHVEECAEGSPLRVGEKLVVAAELVEKFCADAKISQWKTVQSTIDVPSLTGVICAHPLRGLPQYQGYFDYDVPLYFGDFVTTEAGTGFVHIAPGHGEDDFNLGQKYKVKFDETVGNDGRYLPHVIGFAGKAVYTPEGKVGDANGAVLTALKEAGALLHKQNIKHSYPHSWRSKAPLIFRTTPQWFIALDNPANDQKRGLRDLALSAIGETEWVPASGENRIRGMVQNRPDWCISRQRAWGVPIAIFVDKKTGIPLRDQKVLDRVAAAFDAEGSDAWYRRPAQEFLGNDYNAEDYEQVFDVADVWFESGSTHAFCLNPPGGTTEWPNLTWPASLYCEGSDQHRGWFQSSLMESCGTLGRAPYKAVLTNGFVLDEKGYKMSKSLGNVIAPQDVIDKSGADILRLWVFSTDYTEDMRAGPEIFKQVGDLYRRFRNTLRYLLGALEGMSEAERVAPRDMPELERWVLHRLHEVDAEVRQAIRTYDFNHLQIVLHHFCANDLSAFYFDIRKDSLYCDRPDSMRRRASRTVMELVFEHLVRWLAPILCFTAEEAWLARHPGSDGSVHLQTYLTAPAEWHNAALADRWEKIRALRRVVTGAMELARNDKKIGSSLQAAPQLYVAPEHQQTLSGLDLAEIFIASGVALQVGPVPAEALTLTDVPGIGVVVETATGEKCERCWQVLVEVTPQQGHLCNRCHDAVSHIRKEAA